jgi:hypothetical protein
MWLPIPFTDHEASDKGEIRNGRGKILRQRDSRRGKRVNLGRATAMVHTLVLKAWTGQPLTRGYYPKHRNGDRSDNRPENLVWAGRPK